MRRLLGLLVPIAIFGALYLYDHGKIDLSSILPGQEPAYKPIRVGGPVPKEIFGLRRVKNGVWKDSSGQVVYRQARVYAGGSKPQPLKPVREDGCKYDKDKVVNVVVDSDEYPASALHLYLGARAGVPQVLHINRNPGYDIRSNSLEGIPSNSTTDRDETPFAISNEAVVYNRTEGTSDIAFIPYGDNRGSGSSMGGQLSDYCTGQAFRIVLDPPQ